MDFGPDLCGLSETFSQPFRLSLKDNEARSGETHKTPLQLLQLGQPRLFSFSHILSIPMLHPQMSKVLL